MTPLFRPLTPVGVTVAALVLAPLTLILVAATATPAFGTNPAFDTTHVRANGQICRRVPRGPDEWYSGPPYRVVCQQIARPAGLPAPVRR